jgi:hypothetical protein
LSRIFFSGEANATRFLCADGAEAFQGVALMNGFGKDFG